MFLFFFIGKFLFGLNPFAYHITAFILHAINSFLIGYLSFRIFRNLNAAYISSFLYATAAFHFMALSWLSLTWNIIGTTFFLLAFATYLNFLKLRKQWNLVLTLIFFSLSLLSSEFALGFGLFIILFEIFYKSNLNRRFGFRNLSIVLLVFVLSAIYLAVRLVLVPIPAVGEYVPVFDSRLINNSFWYIAWLANVPEVIKYNIKLSQFSFSSDLTFLEPFRSYLFPIIISLAMFIVSSFYLSIKKLNTETLKKSIMAISFLILGLLPVTFLPNHSFPYYLTIPSIGFFFLVAHLITGIYSKRLINTDKIFLAAFLLGWFLTSFLTISFTKKTHWIAGEQAISQEVTEKIIQLYPILEKHDEVTIFNSNTQIKQSLMDQNAMQVIYKNDSLETIYK